MLCLRAFLHIAAFYEGFASCGKAAVLAKDCSGRCYLAHWTPRAFTESCGATGFSCSGILPTLSTILLGKGAFSAIGSIFLLRSGVASLIFLCFFLLWGRAACFGRRDPTLLSASKIDFVQKPDPVLLMLRHSPTACLHVCNHCIWITRF